MILVDSSIWISWFRREANEATDKLRDIDPTAIIIGDLVALEVLQGVRFDRQLREIETEFAGFGISPMLSPELAFKAAANYRALRRRGITIRKTIDLIIGTFCIENDHALLHADRDFLPMAEHLGLRLA